MVLTPLFLSILILKCFRLRISHMLFNTVPVTDRNVSPMDLVDSKTFLTLNITCCSSLLSLLSIHTSDKYNHKLE